MIPQPRPLIEVFSDIADVRKSRGKRHPYLRSARPVVLRHAVSKLHWLYRAVRLLAQI